MITIHSQFINYRVNKDMTLSKLQVMVRDREAQRAAAHGVGMNWTQLGTEQKQQCI